MSTRTERQKLELALSSFRRRVFRDTGVEVAALLLYSEHNEGSTFFFCRPSLDESKVEQLMICSLNESQEDRKREAERLAAHVM